MTLAAQPATTALPQVSAARARSCVCVSGPALRFVARRVVVSAASTAFHEYHLPAHTDPPTTHCTALTPLVSAIAICALGLPAAVPRARWRVAPCESARTRDLVLDVMHRSREWCLLSHPSFTCVIHRRFITAVT